MKNIRKDIRGDVVRILQVEDSVLDAELVIDELRADGIECEVRLVDTEADYVEALRTYAPDIVLSDLPQIAQTPRPRAAPPLLPLSPRADASAAPPLRRTRSVSFAPPSRLHSYTPLHSNGRVPPRASDRGIRKPQSSYGPPSPSNDDLL
mgnify:CR=1 FL=1